MQSGFKVHACLVRVRKPSIFPLQGNANSTAKVYSRQSPAWSSDSIPAQLLAALVYLAMSEIFAWNTSNGPRRNAKCEQ